MRSSSKTANLRSSYCCCVVEIMFSLTTAVKMDSNVHELVTMKKTNANFTDGTSFINSSIEKASLSEAAPLITRNNVNMLSGTFEKGIKISSSTSMPCGIMSRWPMRRVARIPAAYKLTIVKTRTQMTPCSAATTPTTRKSSGRTAFTSFTRRRMRMRRAMRISITAWPRSMPSEAAWWWWALSAMTFTSKSRKGTTQESSTELTTIAASNMFQPMSGFCEEKKNNPCLFKRTASSKT
mmetsp:Transcript_113116/g.284460  ORF Transcript_113116/g.284460 Transcript_113116/m.284460 type:complete len:238 (-) Transcript_113116:103-816(-)